MGPLDGDAAMEMEMLRSRCFACTTPSEEPSTSSGMRAQKACEDRTPNILPITRAASAVKVTRMARMTATARWESGEGGEGGKGGKGGEWRLR